MKDTTLLFYEKYADYAYRVALVRTNNKADAEDLAQEVVLKIIRNQDILKELVSLDESQAKGYLARAVVNMTIEQYKKSSSRLNRERKFASTKMIAIDETDHHDGIADENKHAILEAVRDLPEKYQTIIMLKFYEGHSNSELSNLLNLKEVSIRSLISRAISKLKSRLVTMGIMLSAVSINQHLEATELVPAPPELKAKLILSIQNNYQALSLTSGTPFSLKLIGVLFLSTLTGFALFKYGFPKENISEQTVQAKALEPAKRFEFELDTRHATSEAELIALVESKLNLKSDSKFLVSYKNKGINTVGSKGQLLELPYTINPDIPIVVTCEAEVLRGKGNSYSSIGLYFSVLAELGDRQTLMDTDQDAYSLKFTILNNLLFTESSLFKGIKSYKIKDEAPEPLKISASRVTIRRITLHEMTSEEINAFKEKNAEIIKPILRNK